MVIRRPILSLTPICCYVLVLMEHNGMWLGLQCEGRALRQTAVIGCPSFGI